MKVRAHNDGFCVKVIKNVKKSRFHFGNSGLVDYAHFLAMQVKLYIEKI